MVFVDRIGQRFIGGIVYTLRLLSMIYLSFRGAIFDQTQGLRTIFSVVSAQIYFTGWQAMFLVSILALAAGALVAIQFVAQLSFLGNAGYIGQMVVIILFRELGPLVIALLVIARSGTAVASEIGSLRVNREIEALQIMGIDPLSFIVFPRVVGGIVSVLCLAFYFDVISIAAVFGITHFIQGMPLGFFTDSLSGAFEAEDVLIFFVKNTFNGTAIFVISCYQGFQVRQSPEIPQFTTKAVVNSIISVVIFNLFISSLFYLNQLTKMGIL